MKPFYTFLILITFLGSGYAQEDIPPFKFTSVTDLYEFPQTEATGGTAAQLPLYTITSGGFEMPVALSYDMTGNSNLFYVGNQFGDAWNLNIAATISREVYDKPGEYSTGMWGVKCGTTDGGSYHTKIYKMKPAVPDEIYYSQNPGQHYRAKHDVYTFSVMGLNGKFTIYRENGMLKAEVFESSDFVNIEIQQMAVGENINAILLYDKNGYTYKFASKSNISHNEYYTAAFLDEPATLYADCGFDVHTELVLNPGNNHTTTTTFPEGHLIAKQIYTNGYRFWKNMDISEIYDKDNRLLVSYEYENVFVTVPDKGNTWINGLGLFTSYDKLYLKTIHLHGTGKIDFLNTMGSNNHYNVINSYTNAIEIKDVSGAVIKKITFEYITPFIDNLSYLFTGGGMNFRKRLLTSVKEWNVEQSKATKTTVAYKDASLNSASAVVDRYGFLASRSYCPFHLHAGSYKADSYMLQKIQYPTGGAVIYKFEPNTFSRGLTFMGDYNEYNYDNRIYEPLPVTTVATNTYRFSAQEGDHIFIFHTSPKILQLFKGSDPLYNNLLLNKIKNQEQGITLNENLCKHLYSNLKVPAAPGNNYTLKYGEGTAVSTTIKVFRLRLSSTPQQFRYAEGNRIAQIAYFKDDVNKNILATPSGALNAEKLISFTYIDAPGNSSGVVRNSFYSDQLKSSQLLYDKIDIELKGIGKKRLQYDVPDYYNENFRADLKKSITYSLSGSVISTENNTYHYTPSAVIYNTTQNGKQIITQNHTTLSTYEGGAYTEQQHVTDFDPVHRYPTQSITTLPALSETHQQNHTYSKLGNVYVKNSSTVTTNGIQTSRAEYTYNAQADLLYQQTAKGSNALEKTGNEITRITQGRVEEYWLPNGVYVAQVWGYNNTAVVAELKNVRYSSIASATLTAIRNASSAATYNPTNLVNALNQLRAAHTEGLVTTYTYKPQVGLSSSTDANGLTTTYLYDDFNRLYQVIDPNGKAINRYEYNFKN